ncbi:BLUF domain-containing protein [Azohydromonas australica]|uniref:BLUF domain-containing protein n=1 Tax=Azohydromonas australica TaxID=364039 RepID=UPI00041BC824|nr:BLUF domain-containing protein [Azohydromonas australica]
MPFRLIHCIYASAAARGLPISELTTLLHAARRRNAQLDITGMLLYAEGSFFQVLEGPAAVVDALFAQIQTDARHEQVTLIIREPITRRTFADWTMGFDTASREELDGLSGVNDFLGSARSFIEIDAGRAHKLLAGFRDGRWRKKPAPLPTHQA